MPFPLDPRVLALLSVFDDTSVSAPHQYDSSLPAERRRYVHRSRTGELDVTVWTHSGTAWVSLRGLLGRRAARALTMVLAATEVSAVVLNVADLTLPTASGGTPLIKLCATLSYAGRSVAVIGRDDEASDDGASEDGTSEDASSLDHGQLELLLAGSR